MACHSFICSYFLCGRNHWLKRFLLTLSCLPWRRGDVGKDKQFLLPSSMCLFSGFLYLWGFLLVCLLQQCARISLLDNPIFRFLFISIIKIDDLWGDESRELLLFWHLADVIFSLFYFLWYCFFEETELMGYFIFWIFIVDSSLFQILCNYKIKFKNLFGFRLKIFDINTASMYFISHLIRKQIMLGSLF